MRLFPVFCLGGQHIAHTSWPLRQRKAETMQDWAKAFYKSQAWLKCRNSYIRSRVNLDGGICEECKEEQGYIVHHKVYLTKENVNNPEISLNHDNLMYVCKNCHDQFDGHGVRKHHPRPLVEFDATGMPIRMRSHARVCE